MIKLKFDTEIKNKQVEIKTNKYKHKNSNTLEHIGAILLLIEGILANDVDMTPEKILEHLETVMLGEKKNVKTNTKKNKK